MAKNKSQKAQKPSTVEGSSGIWNMFTLGGLVVAVAVLVMQSMDYLRPPSIEEITPEHFSLVKCSETSYLEEASQFPRCIPRIRCGRFVSDEFITKAEADQLLDFAKRAMSLSDGGSGGATIFDLNSGAVSHGEQFVSIWGMTDVNEKLNPNDFDFFKLIHDKVKTKISNLFGLAQENLFLTQPCFFSRLTSTPPKTLNDEYWHSHIDKETYGKFIYTALIYLSDHDADFEGGRFVFIGDSKNITVTPRKARFATFTSGSENPHLVEKVTGGERFALTVAFACDPKAAIVIPKWQ